MLFRSILLCFFFNDTATTEIYTLSLHDALPIWHADLPPVPGYASYSGLGKTGNISGGWVEIMVSDSGEGITPAEIPAIFEKFRQLGDILTTKPTGIGLGLSIARAILEFLGGAVWADSRKGDGSTFHILLPGKME